MSNDLSQCPSCGQLLPQYASNFCPSCGARIVTVPTPSQVESPGYYPPVETPSQPVSAGAYKAVIAILLVIIVLLGAGIYATSHGSLFSLGPYKYHLANPPNAQSIQRPNTSTPLASTATTTWNACGASPNTGCSMTATGWREGTVPDTYDYFVSYDSNVTITVYFFTLGQFVQFVVCNGSVSCVSGSYRYLPASMSQQNSVFKLAEGCGDYVSIFVSSANGIMHPNVAVASNPAPYPTGYCAQT